MRTVIRLTLLLVVGTLINIGVTMACARWGSHYPQDRSPAVAVESVPAYASEYLNDPAQLSLLGPSLATGLRESTARSLACTRVTHTRWADRSYMAYSRSQEAVRFGLPFRSMQYGCQGYFNKAVFAESGRWRIEGWRGGWPLVTDENRAVVGMNATGRIYPLDILPLGFAANSLIYALLLLSLFVPLRVMRDRRRRRGLCTVCGYPVGASRLCTECGADVGAGLARGKAPTA